MNNEKIKGVATYNSILRTKLNDHIKHKLREVGNTELVPSHGSILNALYENGGKMQIKDLYDLLLKQKSTVTEMIKRLEKLGYLEKEECLKDKRVTFVVATQKAMDFREDFNHVSESLLEKVFTDFTDQEAEEFLRLLKKAIKNFT
ncbi:winged helix-turn-helix transcriptional regulator [Acidaminobacter sp. JC074]|uniref:MarR family winged helix-turn-helix transcriptional regulator n=1 Tax=Acidaminobacter sp. JC074 TaxID=2530199 RepID=UPI001F0D9F6C|nr:MarR family winged helix-turn-helix transcriptional regulator [Acidaminobacter sp. JC074]MCH4886876.1 winged helix-turn-helix transcriptional regulator [Acidaminobacter sp. JC074]